MVKKSFLNSFLQQNHNQLCLAQLEMTLGLGGAAVPHCSAMSDISKDPTYRVLVCNKTDICYIQPRRPQVTTKTYVSK